MVVDMTGFNSKRDAAADKLQDGKCKLCVDGCIACDARAQPGQEPGVLRDALAEALTSTYVCGRVWDAWNVGTMTKDDFQPAAECDELLDELVQAVAAATPPLPMQPMQEPVAWGFRSADGAIYDCISPEAHDECEGSYNVPLYTRPPKREAAADRTQEPLECLDCSSNNVGLPATYDSLIDSVKAQPTPKPDMTPEMKHLLNHLEAIGFTASVMAGCSLVFCIVFFWSVL